MPPDRLDDRDDGRLAHAAASTSSVNAAPRVSVIIPVRNAAPDLRQCLSCLAKSDYHDYEVVVVDDASTDGTPAVAREFDARLIELPQRGGPAAARNAGSHAARGALLYFIDADVCVHPDTLTRVARLFDDDPELSAAFGSYDAAPLAPQFLSQYRNLLHHFTHQAARRDAATFWSGCGAIRRDAFFDMGGFDHGYGRPSIEDIELGVRLFKDGRRIILARELQVTHLKRWTLWNLIRTDVRDRALPWTRLILREKSLPNDLNLKGSQRGSALLSALLVLTWIVGVAFFPWTGLLPLLCFALIYLVDRYGHAPTHRDRSVHEAREAERVASAGVRRFAAPAAFLVIVAATLAAGPWTTGYVAWMLACQFILAPILALNSGFYRFLARERGLAFAALVVPMHVLYYLYSSAAFAWVVVTGRST